MVYAPNSLSSNAVMFQKAKSAPQAIAKNITAPTKKTNPLNIPELWNLTDKEIAFLKKAKEQWMDPQWAINFIKEKRKPTFMQQVWQVGKDIAWWTLAWFSTLPTNIIWWALKWLWSIPVAPWLNLPKTPIQESLTRTWENIKRAWEETARQNIAITWARPEAIGTKIWEQVAPLSTAIVWWAATGLTKLWAWAIWTVSKGIAQRSIPTVLKGLWTAGAVWAWEQAIYDVASEGKTTPWSLAVWWALWTVWAWVIAGAPVVSKAVWKIWKEYIWKPIAKWAWKLAERLATKWLMNVADARNALRTLWETADNDAGAIGRWLLNKKVVWWNESSVIKKLWKVSKKQYDNVRKVVWWLDNQWTVWVDKNVENAMTIVGKQIDGINARAWVEIMSRQQADEILKAAQQWTLTYTQKQKAKELMDEFVSIYKKSWDTADSLLAKAAEPVRNKIKLDLEDAATKFTNGKVNLREMNRDVAFAKSVEKAIETKQVANDLKQYVIQWSIWWALTNQWDFSSPEWWAKFIVWAFLWRQAGRLLWSPAFNSNVAKVIDKLSLGTRNALIQYAKAPTVTKLTSMQLDELLKAKQEIKSLSSSISNGNITAPITANMKVPTNMPIVSSDMTKWLKLPISKKPVAPKTQLKKAKKNSK